MPAAFNIAAAWSNIAASGLATITSTTAAAAMPISNLQQQDPLRLWRGTGGAGVLESIFFDFGSVQTLSNWTIDLLTTNLAVTDTTRLRLSVADPTCVTNTYDSGSATGRVDPNYKSLVFLATPASAPRYGRIDLTRAAGSPEAGFLIVSDRTQFTYNYGFDAQFTLVDPSIRKKTKGGQSRILIRQKFYVADITLGFLTETQRWNVVDAIDRSNGVSTPVLFILDPSSSNLGRDSIYGFIESSPVGLVQAFDDSGAPLYRKSYKIEQRL